MLGLGLDLAHRYNILGEAAPSLFDGLKAFWNLSDLTEASGTGLDLTNNGSVTFAAGKIGDGAVFNGSNSLSVTPNNLTLANGGLTISFWVKAPLNAGIQVAIGFFVGENAVYIGWTPENGIIFADLGHGNANYANQANGSILNNIWTHVVLRADFAANTWTSVVNNSFVVRSLPGPVNINDPLGTIYLGKNREGSEEFMIGMLDVVGIWNRPLSNAEITQLYNSGNGLQYN